MVFELHVRAYNATSIDEERKLIEKFREYFYLYKNECQKMGECYVKYFSDMHEKCHNSQNPCFSFAEPLEEQLKYNNENYEELVKNESKKKKLLRTLSDDVKAYIRLKPGIIQSELIKKFDPIVKNEVSELLYQWNKDGKIVREKSGRSYKLKLNGE